MIKDADLWLVRHFALEQLSATATDDEASARLRAYFSSWEWVGHGVYLNLELPSAWTAALRDRVSETLARVEVRIRAFGEFIPLAYVRTSAPPAHVEWRGDIASELILRAVHDLATVIAPSTHVDSEPKR